MTIKKKIKLFTGFINKYLIEETAAVNAISEPLKIIGRDSRF